MIPGDRALGLPQPGHLPAVVVELARRQERPLHPGGAFEVAFEVPALIDAQALEADRDGRGDVEQLRLDRHLAGGAERPAAAVQPGERGVDAPEKADQLLVAGPVRRRHQPLAAVDQVLADVRQLEGHRTPPALRSMTICPPW